MFESLTSKFNDAFRSLSGRGRISESNIHEAMEQVRGALLEADVHYEVVESFIQSVTKKALGELIDKAYRLSGPKKTVLFADSLMRLGFRMAA